MSKFELLWSVMVLDIVLDGSEETFSRLNNTCSISDSTKYRHFVIVSVEVIRVSHRISVHKTLKLNELIPCFSLSEWFWSTELTIVSHKVLLQVWSSIHICARIYVPCTCRSIGLVPLCKSDGSYEMSQPCGIMREFEHMWHTFLMYMTRRIYDWKWVALYKCAILLKNWCNVMAFSKDLKTNSILSGK